MSYMTEEENSNDVMGETERKRKPSFHCGDSKKLRKLVDSFISKTTVHGVRYLSNRPSRNCPCLWRTLLVVCFISVISNVYDITEQALRKHSLYITTINKEVKFGRDEDQDFPLYPGITICRMPPWTEELNFTMLNIVQYAFLALGPPYVSLTPIQFSEIVYPDEYDVHFSLDFIKKFYNDMKISTDDFSLVEFINNHSVKCEDVFISCIVYIFRQNCCDIFKPLLTSMGVCFILSPNDDLKYFLEHQDFSFPFTIDMNTPPHYYEHMEEGFLVVVSDPVQPPKYIEPSMGTWVAPNSSAHLKVKLKMVNRKAQYSSWLELNDPCPTFPASLGPVDLNERYTEHTCTTGQMALILEKNCHCHWLIHSNQVEDEEMATCEPEDLYYCFITTAKNENINNTVESCQEPCIEYNYEINPSYALLGGESASRVVIRYDNQEYIFNEYQRHTISMFESQLGGSLGLMFGASIISVVELIIFIIQWLWYRFIPVRKKKISRRSSHS